MNAGRDASPRRPRCGGSGRLGEASLPALRLAPMRMQKLTHLRDGPSKDRTTAAGLLGSTGGRLLDRSRVLGLSPDAIITALGLVCIGPSAG